MSAVAASPEALVELARRLRAQAAAHAAVRTALARAVDEAGALGGPAALVPSTGALVRATAGAGQLTTTIDELVGSIDALARFVTEVADALDQADTTLAQLGRDAGSGVGPWTRLGSPGGSSQDRRYARGIRRTVDATFAGPLARGRVPRQVSVGKGAVQDGWGSPRVDVSVFDLSRVRTAGRGASTRFGTEQAHVDLDVFAGAAATGRVSAGVGDAEAHVTVQGSVEVGAHARAAAFAGTGLLGVGGAARVFVGAQAAGEALVGVGRTGVDVHAEAHALLGGAAEVDGEVDLLGVRTLGHAGVMYGVGGEADVDVQVGLQKIAVHLDVGATVGLGISLGVDVSLSPRAVAGGVASVAQRGAGVVTSGYSTVKGWFS